MDKSLPLCSLSGKPVLILLILILLPLLLAGQPHPGAAAAPPGWQTACLDCPHYFSEMSGRSLVLDSQQRAHIAYGGKELYYAKESGNGGWEITVVDDTLGNGRQATLALDGQERPHILYQTANNGGLHHAWYDSADWQLEFLDTGYNPWLLSAADGTLRATWIGPGGLTYGVFDGLDWQTQVVEAATGYPSLALDSQLRPHIAYLNGTVIHHATLDGPSWQITPFADGLSSSYPAVAVGPNDEVHLVHSSGVGWDTTFIVHRRRILGQWQTAVSPATIVFYSYYIFREYSLVAGSDGRLFLALSAYHNSETPYPDYLFSSLFYSEWDGRAWQPIAVLGHSLAPSTHASLVLDDQAQPYIAHKDSSDLVLTVPGAGSQVVDRGGFPAGETSLLQDVNGRFHALHRDDESDVFRYSTAVSLGGPWTRTRSGVSGFSHGSDQLAMALGPPPAQSPGSPPTVHIIHDGYSRTTDDSLFSFLDGQLWWTEILTLGGGSYDIAVSHTGGQYAAVHNQQWSHENDGGLVFTTRIFTNYWSTHVVDDEIVDGRLDLALDHLLAGHIAYRGPEGLRYASKTPGGWLIETVALGWPDYISLALESGGRPHIAWYEVEQGALKYATHDGTAWRTAVLDDAGDTGQYSSLALDSHGRAHISYYDASNGDLKYAFQDGGQWHVETLANEGDVGSHTALLLLGHDYPAIAYLDRDRADMMIIYRPFLAGETVYLPTAWR